MSYIGTTEIGKIFLGDVEIDKAYLGDDLVFSGTPYVPTQYTVTFNPSSYTGDTPLNPGNAYKNEDTSDYARLSFSKNTTRTTYWRFDTSSIPANAVIDSVECRTRFRVSNTQVTANMQLCYGTTTKGDVSENAATTDTVVTLSGATWSRAEASDIRLRWYGTRGNTGSGTNYSYNNGATLTIKYTV